MPSPISIRQVLPALVLLLAAALPMGAHARPAIRFPTDAGAVLEVLPRGYARIAPQARAAKPSLSHVQALLEASARSGDARLAARAQAQLGQLPPSADPQTVRLFAAFLAQHRHDFAGAIRELDAALEVDPRHAGALLARSQVQLVRGRLDLARRDCLVLALAVDSGQGTVCLAAWSLRRGDTRGAAQLADHWLGQAGSDDPSRRYMLVLRAEVAARAGQPADAWFRRALAVSPQDVRSLAAYARYLRGSGRHAEALDLLASAPSADGLLFQRTLAAWALGTPEASALVSAQARRFREARTLGAVIEARDEAEFLLATGKDAPRALSLALENFAEQRDHEDVELLLRSARAAGRPEALAPLRAWARDQQVPLS